MAWNLIPTQKIHYYIINARQVYPYVSKGQLKKVEVNKKIYNAVFDN